MRVRILIAAILASGVACLDIAPGDKVYSWNDLMLLTSYTAKDYCSCLFVMGQSQSYCNAWIVEDPAVASWSADLSAKTVSASAGLFWGARSHFINAQVGCVEDQ